MSNVQCPMSNVRFRASNADPSVAFVRDIELWTLDIGHWTDGPLLTAYFDSAQSRVEPVARHQLQTGYAHQHQRQVLQCLA
jgi:hypothetical protein